MLCVHYSHGEALVVEPLLHALEDTEESPLKDYSIVALATVTKVGMCRMGGKLRVVSAKVQSTSLHIYWEYTYTLCLLANVKQHTPVLVHM